MLSVHSSPLGNLGAKDTGGMSIYIREVARELVGRGVEVDIFTRANDNAGEVVQLGDGLRLIYISAGETEFPDKIAVYPNLPIFIQNLEEFRGNQNLTYNAIYSHYWLSGWVGERLSKQWRVPHFMMFHTIAAVKNALNIGEMEPALRLAEERALAGNGNLLVAATEREKRDLMRYYNARPYKICVIPCGVNMEMFRPQGKLECRRRLGWDNRPVILFVGRIEPLKGIDQLIRAMQLIKSTARLVVVGGDESSSAEITRLKQLTDELNLTDSVVFNGRVPHEELPVYYSAADVCAVPSYHESFGLVALEALACGTPVVATDVGSLRDIIQSGLTGYVTDSNAPLLMAEKINLVLDGSAGTPEYIRGTVADYTWANVAERFYNISNLALRKGECHAEAG